MQKSNYEIEILVNGSPVKEYFHDEKHYIEGRKDTRFSLRLCNNSWQRKLFVPSIDGLSVMDGEECSFKSGGYLVDGHSAITIDGWRVSDKQVAEFFFSDAKRSYSKRSGKGVANLGVIGCAVFNEKVHVIKMPTMRAMPTDYHGYDRSTQFFCLGTNLSCSTTSASADLGTGWGDQKLSEVTTVSFERNATPDAVFEIFYNTRENLKKMGVVFKQPVYVTAQAFPGQYCKPPKN